MLPALLLADAHIRHRRYAPRKHSFSYNMGYLLVDVDRLDSVCQRSPLWRYNGFNCVSLYDHDLLQTEVTEPAGASVPPVRAALATALRQQLGHTLTARQPVYVLTLPRYFGFAFNPVSFYWVYAEDGRTLQFIAAHITNTPWHERHLYCLACSAGTTYNTPHSAPTHRFMFAKRFHVSPFMPMALDYDWRFRFAADARDGQSVIHMQLREGGRQMFDATMSFRPTPMSAWQQHLYPLRYPLQSLKVVLAIYWQALRLWLKRIPFFTHPGKIMPAGPRS